MQIYVSKTYIYTFHIYYRDCDVGQSRESKRTRDKPEESAHQARNIGINT